MSTYVLRKGVAKLSDLRDGSGQWRANQVFYVDSVNGSDGFGGTSWDDAFATLQKGLNVARYLPGTTTIDNTKDAHKLVLVAPGHYNEAIAFSGYNISVVGCIDGRPGKDYGVSINYDGATDTYAGVAFSGSGIRLENLHIYMAEALPGIWIAGGDNNLIQNCVLEGDGTNATSGIYADSLKGSVIRDCVIQGFVTAGVYGHGGNEHYTIHGEIANCQIHSDATGAKGVFIDQNMTAYNFRIHQNHIDVEGGGSTSIGIDVDTSGNVSVTDNYVIVHTTPITCAANGSLHNHVTISGNADDVYDDDDA